MRSEIPIRLPDNSSIDGPNPLILIGPNGVGKTRYGATLAGLNGGTRIAAFKNIQLEQNIGMQELSQAKVRYAREVERSTGNPWIMSNELASLMSKLLAEHVEIAVDFKKEALVNPGIQPKRTKIDDLHDLWKSFFPKREIELDKYRPMAKSRYSGSSVEYPIMQLSDGE